MFSRRDFLRTGLQSSTLIALAPAKQPGEWPSAAGA